MLLTISSIGYPPSLVASSCIFVALVAQGKPMPAKDSDEFKCAMQLFGTWYHLEEFEKCVDHVRLSWAESRYNPHFSRFDAVNNKYDQMAHIINLRQLQPLLVQAKLFECWFYAPAQTV